MVGFCPGSARPHEFSRSLRIHAVFRTDEPSIAMVTLIFNRNFSKSVEAILIKLTPLVDGTLIYLSAKFYENIFGRNENAIRGLDWKKKIRFHEILGVTKLHFILVLVSQLNLVLLVSLYYSQFKVRTRRE